MPKKPRAKKHQKLSIVYYLRIYFVLISISLVIFSLTSVSLNHSKNIPACANSKSCISDLTQTVENNVLGTFEGKTVIPPKIDPNEKDQKVMGIEALTGEKHIYVDLSTQTLFAYQGPTLVLKTLVSTGKWLDTPTGNFHIWEKLLATRMKGGEGADAYDLPNVPYVMYFYNDFGLHGAYWHDNFGHPMSHGCVNMRQVDAKILYEWADGPNGNIPGTEVSICDSITSDRQCVQNNPIQ